MLAAVVALVLLCGCGLKGPADLKAYASLAELDHKRIGVSTGSIQAIQVEERFPDAQIFYFANGIDCLNAMRTGKIDAFADADAILKFIAAENPDLTYIDEPIAGKMEVAAAFAKTESGRQLCDQYSEFLVSIKQSGVYEEILDTWFGTDESKRVVPDLYNLPGPNGTLRIAADNSCVPYIYIKDGRIVGIDVDILVRFCKEYGYKAEIAEMDFSGIIPAIVSGKCDFACGTVTITPERAESVYFSEPTYEGVSILAVLKAPETGSGSVFSSVLASFEKTF